MKLEALFLSKARAEIFRQLFSLRNAEMHLRAIQRGSGLSAPTIKEELEKLKNLIIILPTKNILYIGKSADLSTRLRGSSTH